MLFLEEKTSGVWRLQATGLGSRKKAVRYEIMLCDNQTCLLTFFYSQFQVLIPISCNYLQKISGENKDSGLNASQNIAVYILSEQCLVIGIFQKISCNNAGHTNCIDNIYDYYRLCWLKKLKRRYLRKYTYDSHHTSVWTQNTQVVMSLTPSRYLIIDFDLWTIKCLLYTLTTTSTHDFTR